MDIGVVIKKYRKEAGMTQEEMANRLGVTTPAVNKWENSNSKPDIELLAPIARLLDISVVTKSELADMMNSFISDDDEKWLIINAKFSSADERVFLCGASSKDAGARITSIVEDYGTAKYNSVVAGLLKNSPLVLPK